MARIHKASLGWLFVSAAGIFIAAPPLAAQEPSPQIRANTSRTEQVVRDVQAANPALRVKIDPQTGLPTRISGLAPNEPTITASDQPTKQDIERAARGFFLTNPMGAAFPQLGASVEPTPGAGGPTVEYAPTNVRTDPHFPGQHVAQVEQRVGGVPVFGSTGKLTINRALAVTALTANFSAAPIASTTPAVPEADAIQSARTAVIANLQTLPEDDPLRALAGQIAERPATAAVSVFDPSILRNIVEAGPARLAWLVTIDFFRVFIDAETRGLLHLYRDQHSVLSRKVFDLSGARIHPGTLAFDDKAGVADAGAAEDARNAFAHGGAVYNYFASKFGRDSFDDNDGDGEFGGGVLESTVRYGVMKNAFWCVRADLYCPKANVMLYGPGYAGALDVVGHEMSHGIIAHEADLIYDGQPGAVNEALADIFGSLIEHETGNGNWLIGEGVPGYSAAEPLRNMADPHLTGPDGVSRFKKDDVFDRLTNRGQPDTMSEVMNRSSKMCKTTGDLLNGCVHFNSGILNKAAYLIAEGGTHGGIAVTGIGRDKLGHIAYRALTTKLNANSDLANAGEAFLQSCFELNAGGLNDFASSDCQNVEKALQAIGMTPGS